MSTIAVTAPTPLSSMEQTCQRIEELKIALQNRAPNYEYLLKTIHIALLADPETVNLLTPEQVGITVSALSLKKGIVLAAAEKGKTVGGKKSLKQVTIDDL